MRFLRYLILLFLCIVSFKINAQDQIVYLNGDKDYVDKIDTVQNDSLLYVSFKKTLKVPLSKVKGYYQTINTKENLKKRYYKREREYFAIDSLYHIDFYHDSKSLAAFDRYMSSILPDDFSQLDYYEGYYITNNLDTVNSLISDFSDPKANFTIFITKDDSSNYKIISAYLVKGYFLKDNHYESVYIIDNEDIERCMYIQKKIAGKLNLFYKPSVPYSALRGYIIGKQYSNELIPVSLSSANSYSFSTENYAFKVSNSSFSTSGSVISYTNNGDFSPGRFKDWMPIVLQDCSRVASRVKAEFYTISDIEVIVKEYNKCF